MRLCKDGELLVHVFTAGCYARLARSDMLHVVRRVERRRDLVARGEHVALALQREVLEVQRTLRRLGHMPLVVKHFQRERVVC